MNIIKRANDFFVIDNYSTYKNRVMAIKRLTAKDEFDLAVDFKNNGCIASAQKLIVSQLKAVVRIAKGFSGYGISEEDLVQEGNIGLMKAVKNFDPNKKIRLYSYAILWIKAEMQSFILNNFKMVKLSTTNNLKKLFFKFKKTQKELIDCGEDKKKMIGLISKKLNIKESDVESASEYFSDNTIYLDCDDADGSPLFEIGVNETPETICIKNIDGEEIRENIILGMNELSERERLILKSRYFSEEKITHKELSEKMAISSERIRQIEAAALLKVKLFLESKGINKSIAL